jgi:hypothetical protein
MALPEMEMVKDAALKYDKPTLGRMAQMGQISPTIAVMAGMMRDRIVQSEMKPPAPPTVAEEVMQPMGQRMGLGAIAPGAEMQGQPPQPPMQPPAPQGGVSQIPVPEQMFERPQMAGGGIVAFQAGGGPALMAQYEKEVREMSEGRRMQFSPELKPIIDQLQAPRRASEQAFLRREQQQMLNNPMISFTGSLAAQGQPTTPAQQIAIPGVDDSAEMARFARQAQGTGVPLSSSGLAALTQEAPPPPPPGERPAAAPAAPTSAVPGLREQLMGRIGEAYPDLAGGAKPTEPSVAGIFQERAEAERIAGVDKDFFKNEARNIVKQRDELKGDKKEAANMRLIEAGLRIMGGESPYAFVNIGKGASEALKGFADDVKDIQKTKREYDKSERELRTAEQLYARNKSDEALKEVQRRRELAQDRNTSFQTAMINMDLQLAKLGVEEAKVRVQTAAAAKPSQFQEMYEAEKADPERFRRFRESLAPKDDALQRQKLADEALAKDLNYLQLSRSRKPEDIRRANEIKQGIYTRYGVGAGAGGADPLGLFR